ncbi:hypothetical protein J5N97_008587 [Dioscorea zingiberensis]|uniref:Pentatricopeptide repeat-containing protein n=1 Tax=Dioscorea zingiberensis TaxID=325984 RepID=A0A9D5CWK8_9LILI|nr:hypothetical protein J5N97_008587 [Dioscorea zingiberensis]
MILPSPSLTSPSVNKNFFSAPLPVRSFKPSIIACASCNHGSQSSTLEFLCKEGKVDEAFQIIDQMDRQGLAAKPVNLVLLLQACAEARSLLSVRKAHQCIERSSCRGSRPFIYKLAEVYCKLGSMEDARKVFDEMPVKPVVKRREAYVKVRKLHERMRAAGYVPDTLYVLHDIDEKEKSEH